jgi:hypothetical protein
VGDTVLVRKVGILQITTTAAGWGMARAGRSADQRRWMICSLAPTFAFVSFRLELQAGVVLLGVPCGASS